jgi:hypothetical protein
MLFIKMDGALRAGNELASTRRMLSSGGNCYARAARRAPAQGSRESPRGMFVSRGN